VSDSHPPAVFRPVIRERDPGIRLDRSALPWRNGLVVRATNWLGDTLMTLPAMHKLSVLVPEPCGFFVVCPAKLAPVWRAAEWVSEVIPMQGKRLGKEGFRRLRQLKPGVGVVLPNSFGSALDLWLAGIPVRLGRSGRLRRLLLTHRIAEWPRGENTGICHQLSYYLELVSAFGYVPWNAECPELNVPGAETVAQRFGIAPHVRTQWMALAPGAAYGTAKQWPAENYADVAEWWRKQGGQVVVVGAPNERAVASAIARRVPGVLNLTGYTKLDELMAVLKSVDVVVANDSGAPTRFPPDLSALAGS
jgi:heptosyltransferase-2